MKHYTILTIIFMLSFVNLSAQWHISYIDSTKNSGGQLSGLTRRGNILGVSGRDYLLRSDDLGASWKKIDFDFENRELVSLLIIDSLRWFAIGIRKGDNSLLKSDDGGVSWSKVPGDCSQNINEPLYYFPENQCLFFEDLDHYVYRFQIQTGVMDTVFDKDTYFNFISGLLGIHFTGRDTGRMYIDYLTLSSSNKIRVLQTMDGGKTWQYYKTIHKRLLGYYLFIDEEHILINTEFHIISYNRITEAEDTIINLPSSRRDNDSYLLDMAKLPNGHVIICGGEGLYHEQSSDHCLLVKLNPKDTSAEFLYDSAAIGMKEIIAIDDTTWISLLLHRKIILKTTGHPTGFDEDYPWDLLISALYPEPEIDKSHPLKIFPNPSRGIFHIHSERGYSIDRLLLYNAQGRFITAGTSSTPNQWKIDLSTYPDDVYYLITRFKDGKKTLSRIVKR